MKNIQLNDGFICLVDDEDFELVNSFHWRAYRHGQGYRVARPNCHTRNGDWHYKNALLHRFILKIKKGEMVDHIDGNPLNNQKNNLRICTHSENMRNHPRKITALSRFKGLHRRGDKWRVRICLNRKRFNIGTYESEIEAALAYNVSASFMFREFARLNVV